MPDKPFVINDRRKFTSEGELRPDVVLDEPKTAAPAEDTDPAAPGPHLVTSASHPDTGSTSQSVDHSHGPQAVPPQSPADLAAASTDAPPPLSAEQIDQATRAYDATAERLDTAMRAADPGAEHAPPMTFERLVQSLYMQAIMQLGGVTEPGQQPRVDIIGARSTTDMLAVIAEKSKGNLSQPEQQLVESALFEMRMGFLEVTQMLARQAAARQTTGPGVPPRPDLVR